MISQSFVDLAGSACGPCWHGRPLRTTCFSSQSAAKILLRSFCIL